MSPASIQCILIIVNSYFSLRLLPGVPAHLTAKFMPPFYELFYLFLYSNQLSLINSGYVRMGTGLCTGA